MRKIFTTLLCAAVSVSLWADYQTIGGLYYSLNTATHEAKVAFWDRNHMPAETDVVVPATVVYDEVTYTVTGVVGTGSIWPAANNTIESITLPATIKSIDQRGFSNLRALLQIIIPDSVTSIGSYAFYNCWELTSVDLPYGKPVTIGESAFNSCSKLDYVYIPQNVTSIGESAFRYCSQLVAVDMEAINPPTVESNAFDGCADKLTFYIPCADKYTSAAGWSDLAANTTKYEFNAMGVMLELQSEDPAKGSVARTGEAISCSNLTTTIEATPESGFAFLKWDDGNTDNPRTLTLTRSTALTAMFDKAIALGDTIINQVDGKDMYFKITSLTPREVKLIPYNDWADAFTGALNIPDEAVDKFGKKYDVVEIADEAVRAQYLITSVKLPRGVRLIESYAFQSCPISSITFPASIEKIATFAFGSTSLTEVHFEGTDNLKQIISNAFGYTPLLENAPNGWIIADSVAIDYRGTSPELLDVPDSVTFVSMLHSRGNNDYSHNWESTTGVRLGHKVKAISMGAFMECENATSLSICAPIPPKVSYSATKPFNARENTMRLKLSCELTDAELTAYNAADYWGNRFEGIDTVLIWNVNLVQTVGGTIAFEGTPDCSGATVVATPASGYKFVRWSDDSTDNPHTFVITADTEISAVFDVASGINSSSLQGGDRGRLFIHDGQIFILRGDKTYTVTGQEVR